MSFAQLHHLFILIFQIFFQLRPIIQSFLSCTLLFVEFKLIVINLFLLFLEFNFGFLVGLLMQLFFIFDLFFQLYYLSLFLDIFLFQLLKLLLFLRKIFDLLF